jgi:hypothetical protein
MVERNAENWVTAILGGVKAEVAAVVVSYCAMGQAVSAARRD